MSGIDPMHPTLPEAVRLHLHTTVQLSSEVTDALPLKARKARALLALIAMSATQSISRPRAAATLWSSVERMTGLARLRDVLHDLRKSLDEAGADFLDLQGDTILFKPGAIRVEIGPSSAEPTTPSGNWSEFLVDLEGIDPALDRWLLHIRAECRKERLTPTLRDAATQVPENGARRGEGPSVIVTELDAGSPTDAGLAKLLTDELGVALARLRWFRTITRGIYGQRLSAGSEDLSKIADYALVGILQCDGAHCRLLLKLIDLQNLGAIEWASSFEQERQSNIAVQEALANAAAARLDTELLLIEANRQRHRSPLERNSSAYALVLQAVPAIYRLERDPFLGAGHLLEQATLVDRESAMAHGWLAYWHVFYVGQGWATNPYQSMTHAAKIADRAMMLDPKDARATTISGHVKAFLNRRLDEATALHELALQLNPALALAWHLSGMTHAYAGRLDEAFRCISQCRQLAPTDPQGFFAEGALGIVHLLRHEHEKAVALGRRVTERHPNFTSAFKSYLAALGHLGERTEAARVMKRLLLLEPRFSLQRFHATAPYQRVQDLEHFTAGLRLAGVT